MMRRLYSLLFLLLMPLLLMRLYWRGFRAPGYRDRWQERLGYLKHPAPQNSLWVHAVSVGEVQAAAPFIRQLLQQHPELPLLITTATPTGAQRVKDLFASQVQHYYAPFDIPFICRRFFTALRPILLVLVETEIWPNLIHEARLHNVPSLLANARLSARSAKKYHKLAGFTRETLQEITLIAPQGEADAERFRALGARGAQLEVTGSIKFDIRLPASLREQSDVLRRTWGAERPIWLAASTHKGEEEQILAAHIKICAVLPNALLVLVPRHPERFDQVAVLASNHGFNTVRRSEQHIYDAQTQVFLGDTMGELPLFMGAVDLAFIGGSLVPHGGHNILEAAAQGVPVMFGPHMFNFAEISELFIDRKAAVQVVSGDALAEQIIYWLRNASVRSQYGESGRDLVEQNRGALQRLMRLVDRLLDQPQNCTRPH